jgi:two-component system phosphate regulon sensor histidine kinase PhoR
VIGEIVEVDFEKTVDNDAFCIGNEELIQLAIKNIFLNAIQYGKANRVIKIKSTIEQGLIGISVTDFGFGIKPENALTILENFSRQKLENRKNNPDGIGIGLSLVSEIMLHQKGKLIVRSNNTIGCEVLLLFPRLTLPVTDYSN